MTKNIFRMFQTFVQRVIKYRDGKNENSTNHGRFKQYKKK